MKTRKQTTWASPPDVLTVIAGEPKRRWRAIDILTELEMRDCKFASSSDLTNMLHMLADQGEIVREAGGWWRWPTIGDASAATTSEAMCAGISDMAGQMRAALPTIDPRDYRAAWSKPIASEVKVMHSREVECIRLLEELDECARDRVLDYWQDRREQERYEDVKGAGA